MLLLLINDKIHTHIPCPTSIQLKRLFIHFQIKHIRGILFESESDRKSTTTKKDQTEVKKKTSQKKRSDKPVVEQNSDVGDVPAAAKCETTKSVEDSESNAIVIISDDDIDDVDKPNNEKITVTTPISNAIPSTSKNLHESGKSFMGCSKTPIKPSQTVVRAEATSSGIKSKNESTLDKAYLCGRCGKFSDNTIAIVRAHQATAHPNVECEVLMRNTNKEAQQSKSTTKLLPDATAVSSKSKFSESINYVCYNCIFKAQSPTTIYKHWKENHKFPKRTTKTVVIPGRPFKFRILKTFQCCYCRRNTSYADLKNHTERSHPNETFAMIDNLNPKKCALCSYEFNNANTDVIDHFKESHNQLKPETSIELQKYVSDELVDEIVSLLPREQVKCIQPNCNIVFFSMAELDSHTNEKHAGSEAQFVSIPNDPIMYGCTACPETNSNESAMVGHIRDHFLLFQCKFCDNRYNHLEMLKDHHSIMHQSKDATYRNIDVSEYLDKCSAMKIIFPNGLVLTKAEAKHTRYGAMDGITKLLTEMNIKDLEMLQKQQEEKIKECAEPVVVKKTNLKRRRILDSDSDDSLNSKPLQKSTGKQQENKTEESATPLATKKTNLKRSRILTSDSEYSHSKPLQKVTKKEPEEKNEIAKKANLKRSRIVDSDSDDSQPPSPKLTRSLRRKRQSISKSETSPTKPSISKLEEDSDDNDPLERLIPTRSQARKLRRKSNMKSETVPTTATVSKLKVEANISTSDDSEPLQNLIPISNYGKRPKPVDLSKIFIDMPFGTGNLRVSCDRFALIVNINPKLRLKRCTNIPK